MEASKIQTNKVVVSTYGEMVVSNGNIDESTLVSYFAHDNNIILVRTIDTDVAVIGIGLLEKLNVTELWLWSGT